MSSGRDDFDINSFTHSISLYSTKARIQKNGIVYITTIKINRKSQSRLRPIHPSIDPFDTGNIDPPQKLLIKIVTIMKYTHKPLNTTYTCSFKINL